jgi:hypothetical protein
MFEKLKYKVMKWLALQKVKELEAQILPTNQDVLVEDKVFTKEALSMKPLILKKKVVKKKIVKKRSRKKKVVKRKVSKKKE